MASMESLTGQVLHMRKVSRRLMFADIEVSSADGDASPATCRHTLIFKFWQEAGLYDRVTRGHDKLHVGDRVTFDGAQEETAFAVNDYSVLVPWSSVSGGRAFQPLPPTNTTRQDNKADDLVPRQRDPQDLCKFFVNTGRCDVADCAFRHTDASELKRARAEYVRERKERRLLVHEEGSVDAASMRGANKRAEVLADWIVETYGLDYLLRGKVLDVAGGRGDLAFELAVKKGLDCIVVDPRPGKIKRWQAKIIKKSKEKLRLPEHRQLLFNNDFFKETGGLEPSDISLVVGLHPDEATESIVDTALVAELPCCVVPCCVFSALAPHRRLKDGTAPINYNDFCRYLTEKSDQMLSCHLPFAGRNRVLFTLPTIQSKTAGH